ncbi:MAG TPA: methionine--tRNA ligase, partial [Beijerinckiaceae bacterium]|nr:methionine--tRNA ligase [Beijerinckiaceae bacterium]
MAETFYLTTAISYPNGAPHVGHAYELMAADAIVRFQRLDGKDVYFLTGTDEHGQKMLQTARKEGLPVRELADRNAARFRAMGQAFDATNNDFIRTSEPRHYEASKAIWKKMEAAGDIYLSKYSGWYSVRDEAYFDEDDITTDGEGRKFAPSGAPVEWVEEESYFFRLSAYQDRLLKYYEDNPDFIGPDARRNEVLSFVKRGLKDLSVSRNTFDWGVPVPGGPGHVMYVWVDALTNYITGVGYPDEKSQLWKYWPADLHLIGKDIVRFHTVFWPAFLMSAGIAPPKRVFCHGFVLNRGEKMSKSVGNVLDPFTLAEGYGPDAVRYFMLREVPFGQDGNYSHEAIVGRINADLANDFGNLAQRSLSMINKNCGGKVPACGVLTAADTALLAAVDGALATCRAAMKDYALHQILNAIWALIGDTNRYFAAEEPWRLKKSDPARMETVLYVTAEALRQFAILTQPFTPRGATKLLDLLAIPADARSFAALGPAGRLVSGANLP